MWRQIQTKRPSIGAAPLLLRLRLTCMHMLSSLSKQANRWAFRASNGSCFQKETPLFQAPLDRPPEWNWSLESWSHQSASHSWQLSRQRSWVCCKQPLLASQWQRFQIRHVASKMSRPFTGLRPLLLLVEKKDKWQETPSAKSAWQRQTDLKQGSSKASAALTFLHFSSKGAELKPSPCYAALSGGRT